MNAEYFSGYSSRVDDLGSLPDDQKPSQVDQDSLPFVQLGGRRFEILCYKLKRGLFPGRTVALMQGTGDGGRDVVLYEDGRVVEIVQCKNNRDRLSEAKLLEELTKLALHHVVHDQVMRNGVRYELWCPPGLSQSAADIINTWPLKWTEAIVRPVAKKLLRTPSFAKLTWESVRVRVLEAFPAVILPRALDGIQITEIVRSQPDVESVFFKVNHVVAVSELTALLQQCNWFQLKLEDVRYITRRLESFPEPNRVHLLGASIFGVNPAFMQLLTPQELKQLCEATSGAVLKVAELVTHVGLRRVKELMVPCKVSNDTFRTALGWLLALRVNCIVGCLTAGFMPSSDLKRQFLRSTIEDQFETVIDEMWRLVEGKSAGTGAVVFTTSNALRERYPTRRALQDELRTALRMQRTLVLELVGEIDKIVPLDILIVAEPLRFDGTGMMERFGATIRATEESSEAGTRARSGSPMEVVGTVK